MHLNLLIAISLLCWSTWGLFDKKALQGAGHLDVLLFQHCFYLLEVPAGWLLLSYLNHNSWHIRPETWMWAALGTLSSSSATLFYLIAMSRAEASFVLGITAGYPLVVQILAFFYLHEALVPERLFGSVLVGLGVALVGSSAVATTNNVLPTSDEDAEADAAKNKGNHKLVLLMCLLATILWGATGLFDKKALDFDEPLRVYYARAIWDAVLLAVMLLVYRRIKYKIAWGSAVAWKYSTLSAFCLALGTLTYMFAMTMATASYVIVITGCYPLLMYMGAVIFLKEKLSKMRLAGVILVVLGGLLVQNTQSQ